MDQDVKIKAYELAKKQQEIGVAEFFARNRHLLGFDNKKKALLTTVKEAVDNSLDACEEADILPEAIIDILELGNDRYRVTVEDNGPGIVKNQIPKIFAKLLYGSKFFKLSQSLTADEPILIKRNNKAEILPIGNLVNFYLNRGEESKPINNLDIEVPAFDKKTHSYKFRRVSNLIRHKRQNEVIKITIATNRTIKVTGCHSLFTEEGGRVKEVEARNLKVGDKLVVPTKLPELDSIDDINILDYISLSDINKNWFYIYNLQEEVFKDIKNKAQVIHKKTSKSRRFYRINELDILDDSFKQYQSKKFLPLYLVLKLGLNKKAKDGIIKTYYHGIETTIPITLPLTKAFIRFLGFFVAEGHSDKRQIGLTFGRHEDHLIKQIIDFANTFGLSFRVEHRKTSIRVKIFGNIFVKLIRNICGVGANHKHIPEFVFRVNPYLRQEFLDSLYLGDGHNTKGRNQLMLITTSSILANEVVYLWLMQGVLASINKRINKGFGKNPSLSYSINLYGKDIQKSNFFACNAAAGPKKIVQQILQTDLSLLKIKKIEIINEGYDYVYDLSVPECENFVGGCGGISCHNSRGQQGIGISAAVMYGQITTGKPAKIISKIHPTEPAHYYELLLDTQKNKPEIVKEEEVAWKKEHGTKVEIEIEASYLQGMQSVDEYLKQTAIVNPHVTIVYTNPKAEQIIFARAAEKNPKRPVEIKPHPYGVELGVLQNMLKQTENRTLQAFLTQEFSRVGPGTAKEICANAALLSNTKPSEMSREMIEKLVDGIKKTKIIAPPTDCISPIGEELLEKGLRKEINAEFYCATTRPPSVYRGNPFIVEAGIAYGGQQSGEEPVRLLRYANRVPLLYQQGACAITKSVLATAWKNYGLNQSKGSLPIGPITIVVSISSVWVPFTSESKEAIAHYPEIIREVKLALQEVGRKLQLHVHKKRQVQHQLERANLFERYIPEVADSLSRLTGENKDKLLKKLQNMVKKEQIQREMEEMEALKGEVEDDTALAEKTGEDD